jgi:hypothetical protein
MSCSPLPPLQRGRETLKVFPAQCDGTFKPDRGGKVFETIEDETIGPTVMAGHGDHPDALCARFIADEI